MPTGVTGISAYVRDAVYVPLTAAERAAWPAVEQAGPEPEVHARVTFYRKRPQGLVSVYPYRRDPITGSLDKLVSFRIELVESRSASRGGGQRSYPDNSKLATGDWFRFTIAKDGVYKVTYETLRDMGADVSSLSSDRINVYGNHFGLLPFVNNVERPTDLLLNAIQMVDGGDGVFGPATTCCSMGPERTDGRCRTTGSCTPAMSIPIPHPTSSASMWIRHRVLRMPN
jgi:hypothetical protein